MTGNETGADDHPRTQSGGDLQTWLDAALRTSPSLRNPPISWTFEGRAVHDLSFGEVATRWASEVALVERARTMTRADFIWSDMDFMTEAPKPGIAAPPVSTPSGFCPCGAELDPQTSISDWYCDQECVPQGSIDYRPGPSSARWRPEALTPEADGRDLVLVDSWNWDGLRLSLLMDETEEPISSVHVRLDDGARFVGLDVRVRDQGDPEQMRILAMSYAPRLRQELESAELTESSDSDGLTCDGPCCREVPPSVFEYTRLGMIRARQVRYIR